MAAAETTAVRMIVLALVRWVGPQTRPGPAVFRCSCASRKKNGWHLPAAWLDGQEQRRAPRRCLVRPWGTLDAQTFRAFLPACGGPRRAETAVFRRGCGIRTAARPQPWRSIRYDLPRGVGCRAS